ncbi:ATP-dependent RNA helicase HrpA [Methylocaldum szegediense]|uniref:ATP-dependent RNA helicase HrpA n=1 Tax=Methylocaldum szegediense TaxID=73780 RepID=A0ABM9I627_9GAMM|nr:ATP-dependent RNA helicase HrpA [Methylocaldum szegediense]CAI8916181.1 ATP-dependent RNA helicase HrpA [Methylocaldum szegediense]
MQDILDQIEGNLDLCLRKDRYHLSKRLSQLRAEMRRGQLAADRLQSLQEAVSQSMAKRQLRAESVPELDYPLELPVVEKKDEILEKIRNHQVVVVCGETGSGKTTQLPKICLEAGRGVSGYIGHTQPRRIAARTVAARIAEELKQPLGQAVGYKVRFQDQTRPESLIKLMTDGILLAEIQHDRFLEQYDTLIVDEAHERSLNIDFLLGYLKWLLPKRKDLKLIITSATIEPERFARHFGNAPIINVSGRTYPVEIRYRPVEVEEGDETDHAEQMAIVNAVDELWREQPGDILIFLSGEREIRETAESLRKHHPSNCEILPLYSRLSQSEQERVFRPSGMRRIVLATNVAETSLTVPGIRSVIDTGYARISRYSHRSKLQRLPIEKISQASANQRSGRCGRVGPGIAIRLYSEQDYLNRPEFTDPEILRTNLAAVILQMHALKLGDISNFPFVEPPDARLIRDGLRTLQEVNALDDRGQITDIGRKLAKLPVDPRLGRMLLAGAEEHCLSEVAIIVAALSVPDPRERPADKASNADQKHARFRDDNSDFLSFLKLWTEYEEQKKYLSKSKLRQWCRENFLSYVRMTEWHDIHGQIMEVLKGELDLKLNQVPGEYGEIHRALLSGLLSNVCLKQEQNEYVGARGTKLFIHPGSFLFKVKPKWIMAAEQVETTKVYARTVAKIEPEWIEKVGAHLVKHQHYDPHWERKTARAAVYERTTLFGLIVQAGRKIPYERINPQGARDMFIRHALVHMDYDSKAPFFLHNLKLLEEADYLQHKGRRADLLVDEDWLFRWFDERIPQDVVNGVTFERWRKSIEAREPDLLKLSRADITTKEAASLDAKNFPDHFQVGPLRFQLQYRFEPGHEDDGVTVIVPLHLLNQLDPEPFRWLVPGLLREKTVALIKSLPKTLRIHFVPASDHAERVLPMLDYGRGSFYAQLSSALKKTGGIAVSPDSFREDVLPPHLRMNFAVVDEFNTVIDRSRDLRELKARHSADAGKNFQQLAGRAYLHTGCKSWTFGELPRCFDGQYDGQTIFGFPAVVDEGETVGVRVFDTPEEAACQHELGLIRLFRFALAKELKYLKKNLAVNASSELWYRQLPAHPFLYSELKTGRELREDLLNRLMGALFLEGQPDIRSAEQFEKRLKDQRAELVLKADEMARMAQTIFQLYSEVQAKLKSLPAGPTKQDVLEHLRLLVYAGFWVTTPYPQIREMPRYLKAVLHRLEKATQDPLRDRKQYGELAPFWGRYWNAVKAAKGQRLAPERETYRWSLEEFRVSLFAQMLKTAYPVSAKRLEEAWKQLGFQG